MQHTSHSPQDTKRLAHDLAHSLAPGSVLALFGNLGAGKTTFTQGFGLALGISKPIPSPTFVLMRQHLLESGGVLNHLDLYRINSGDDLKSFDLHELFANTNSYTLIEWPEKIESLLPERTIKIKFEISGDNTRKITTHIPSPKIGEGQGEV